MRLLLDSHTFIWFVSDDPRLSRHARALIEDASNERLLSAASHWEIAIKLSLRKLTFTDPFDVFMPRELAANQIRLLPIELPHSIQVAALPFPPSNHRDPFDRLIVAQAIVEGLPVLSADKRLDDYGVIRLW
jgi:PIN domain nuclease of toxin-antitoxin system